MSSRLRLATLLSVLALAVVGVSVPAADADESGDGLPQCTEVKRAVVTDIDETLTTSDFELVMQIIWPQYDQAERAAASATMAAYAERGYWLVYVTARAEILQLWDGRNVRQATADWLESHGFPVAPDRTLLYLSPELLSALYPRPYKAAVVDGLEAAGFTLDWAYGNAETDFQAFADAGIPTDRTFSIGKLAGYGETQPIEGGTYEGHLVTHLPTVDAVCDAAGTPPGPPAICPPIPYDDLLAWLLSLVFPKPPAPTTFPCGT